MTYPQPAEPFSLSSLMPAPSAPAAPTVNIDDIIWRQIQNMQAQGWTLYQRWPGGADFTSRTPPTISTGVHIILTIFTIGFWLIIWVAMELLGGGGSQKWCRLTVDGEGQPHYQDIGRPQTTSGGR
jgi:hypothetical protein